MIISSPFASDPVPEEVLDYQGPALLLEVPQKKPRTYRLVVRIFPGNHTSSPCRSVVYVKYEGEALKLLPGDRILLNIRLKRPPPPDPPCAFDYRSFLERRGIGLTGFARSYQWCQLSGNSPSYAARRMAARMNLRLSDIVDAHFSKEAAPLVHAMVLGNRDGLDTELTTQFSHTGIMHILAVSGLHVSIVWLLLNFMLRPVVRIMPWMRLSAFVLESAGVWCFAAMTGLGPSVSRAAFMFTLFSLAGISYRRHRSLNITAASAVILLLLHPPFLYAAGFQLSFAAVAGIQLWYWHLNSLLIFNNKLPRYCWSVQAVSFSAVMSTAPLAIYYFSMFPLLFPVANMIAVPAAFALVAGSIMVMGLHPLPRAADAAGACLSKAAECFLAAVERIASLPASHIPELYIDRLECGLLMVLFAVFSTAVHRRAGFFVCTVFALLTCTTFFFYRGVRKCMQYRTAVIYHLPEHGETMVTAGKKAYYFLPESVNDPDPRKWRSCREEHLSFQSEILSSEARKYPLFRTGLQP